MHPPSFGLFPEGGVLDRVDKQLSFLVFALDLGTAAEALLAGPAGMWLGAPLSAWTVVPLVTAWLGEHAPELMAGQGELASMSRTGWEMLAVTMLALGVWGGAFYTWLWQGRVVLAYLLTQKLMVPTTTLSFVFAGRWAPLGVRAASFYLIAWVLAETVGFVLKISTARKRPGVTVHAEELSKIRRSFPELQAILRKGESAIESFPSGDTIGSACFTTTLVTVLGYSSWVHGFSFLTAFCRMYFHAHHLLDVVVGWLIGYWCTQALVHVCETHLQRAPALAFDAWAAASSVALFILFHVIASRFKPSLPPDLVVEGRKGF